MSWHAKPFASWDTETTSANPEECRLVTSTLVLIDGAATKAQNWLIAPDVPIPPEATAIHGVTDAYARAGGDEPDVACKEIAEALYTAWDDGMPIVVFNASFDCTVLDRELRRHHGHGLEIRGPIVDPFVIDKHLDPYRKGKRTLTACAEHYNVRLDAAHDATEDALAAARLAWRLAQVYADQLADLGLVNGLQARWRADWATGFRSYLEKQGKPTDDVRSEWPLVPIALTEGATR